MVRESSSVAEVLSPRVAGVRWLRLQWASPPDPSVLSIVGDALRRAQIRTVAGPILVDATASAIVDLGRWPSWHVLDLVDVVEIPLRAAGWPAAEIAIDDLDKVVGVIAARLAVAGARWLQTHVRLELR